MRRSRTLATRVLLLCLLASVAALSACSSPTVPAPNVTGKGTAALHELRSVSELKAQFNRDQGKVRLILLLSPT
jgi:hypothetical protein